MIRKTITLLLLIAITISFSSSNDSKLAKIVWGGSIYPVYFDNEQNFTDQYEIDGTLFLIKINETIDATSIRDRYLSNLNDDNIDEILSDYRSEIKQRYTVLRTELYNSHSDIIDSAQIDISSPYVTYFTDSIIDEYSKLNSEILEIIDNEAVEEISIYITYKSPPECLYNLCGGGNSGGGNSGGNSQISPMYNFSNILSAINATNAMNQYDGSGVNVGIYDGNLIRTGNSGFPSSRGVVRQPVPMTTSNHATNVANVAVGKDGIAPGTNVFSAPFMDGNQRTVGMGNLAQLQWFVDNNVNVVNMSFGYYYDFTYPDGRVVTPQINDPIARMYDQFVADNLITLVAASGNIPEVHMGAPAISSNVITVGSSNYNGTSLSNYHTYLTTTNLPKPLLVAPGTMKIPNGIFDSAIQFDDVLGISYPYEGTSFAAPLVTGAIALMMEVRPILRFFPEAVIALVASASSMHPLGIGNQSSSNYWAGLHFKGGAGLLDVGKLVDSVNDFVLFESNGLTPDEIGTGLLVAHFSLNNNVEINFTLFWFAQVNNNNKMITNYDLYIYLNDSLVKSSTVSDTNVEHIRYKTTSSGQIKIVIKRQGQKLGSDLDIGSVAWSIRQ